MEMNTIWEPIIEMAKSFLKEITLNISRITDAVSNSFHVTSRESLLVLIGLINVKNNGFII